MFTPVRLVRFWFPLILIVVGFAMLIISPDIVGIEGFALMIGGGLGVIVSNRIHRMGLAGERDRDAEFDARAFFDRYGVWPDEATPDQLEAAARDRSVHTGGASPSQTPRRARRP
ncbi:MAG: hypothetical protein ITG02_11565 [Patulibacter sp.]|nr:hypothetical protein [Patulibacter sp.]